MTFNQYELLLSELTRISEGNAIINEAAIQNGFRPEHYKKGSFFTREGDIPQKIGFVVHGLMKYYYIDRDGNEWIKSFAAEKDFVVSYACFLQQIPSQYSIEAMEDTTILSMDFNAYFANINNSMTWCSIARKYTETIYYEKERREASFLKEDGAERYIRFLRDYKHIADRVALKDIASFLGLTPVSLSRIRNKKQGTINKC